MAFGYPEKPQANYTAAIQDKFKVSVFQLAFTWLQKYQQGSENYPLWEWDPMNRGQSGKQENIFLNCSAASLVQNFFVILLMVSGWLLNGFKLV